MEINFSDRSKLDLAFWEKAGNKPLLKKTAQLIRAITEAPFEGIGKPEPLKHDLSGKWSRRISAEHRLVYRLEEDQLFILSLRGHY